MVHRKHCSRSAEWRGHTEQHRIQGLRVHANRIHQFPRSNSSYNAVRRASLILAGILGLVACRQDGSIPDVTFPTHDAEFVPTLGTVGRLELEDGCLVVGDLLLIWPEEMKPIQSSSGLAIADEFGRELAGVGDEVHVGGGHVDERIYDQELLPPACRGIQYWAVGTLLKCPNRFCDQDPGVFQPERPAAEDRA